MFRFFLFHFIYSFRQNRLLLRCMASKFEKRRRKFY